MTTKTPAAESAQSEFQRQIEDLQAQVGTLEDRVAEISGHLTEQDARVRDLRAVLQGIIVDARNAL